VTTRRQLIATASHEAGHAVACVDLDFPFTEAVTKLDGSGYVGAGVRLPRHWGHHFSPYGRDRAEDQIVMFASSPIAEMRLTGRNLDGLRQTLRRRNDWRYIKDRYDALDPGTELEWLVLRSRVLVARRWREVEFVATALVEQRRLSTSEVFAQIELAQIVQPVPTESDDDARDD
jgi:hypothetical protein